MRHPFFIADLHLGHANSIKYCNRPFSNVNEMNEALIENWNKTVSFRDSVYILGDVSFSTLQDTCDMLDRMEGTKYLVAGNHDDHLKRKPEFIKRFKWVKDFHDMAIEDESVPGGKQHLVLCHFPLLSWNRSRYGSFMLHGHVHGRLEERNQYVRRYDCGVDCNGFMPVSYSQLKLRLVDRPSVDCDMKA